MKDNTQPTVVPKLRFPEFRDGPGWEEKPTELLARVTQGGTPDTANTDYWNGCIDWLTPAEMGKHDSPYIASTRRTLTEKGLQSCSSELLPAYSVILSTRAPIGHLAINTAPMAINQGCRGLVPVENVDTHFVYNSLLHAKPRLTDLGAGNTFKELSGSALKGFLLLTPSPAEQHKIADCLSSMDELIVAHGRKLEALRTHKKGLMRQMFPRKGESLPHFRFPEFRDAPEWEEKKLATVIDLISGVHLAPNEYSTQGDVPYFTGPSDFTNKVDDIVKWTAESLKTANAHDTLITVKGSGVGEIWYLTLPKVAIGRQLMAVRAHDSTGFIHHFLTTKRARFESLASGNLIPGLSRSDILDMSTPFPPPREQQRIADCLSSVDDIITSATEQLASLKKHRKSLMQQLFPTAEGR
ncbi:MAG: restriction endonuclease subunit S [Thermoanaerobaculia bacterium]